jgi:hypothetical protein
MLWSRWPLPRRKKNLPKWTSSLTNSKETKSARNRPKGLKRKG